MSLTTSFHLAPGPRREEPVRAAPILIIDDDRAKRLALRAALEPLGFTVIEADSGVEGLRCVMADDIAVILLDVRMPVMNGYETAALIRQRAKTELTPIIFVTAYAPDEVDGDRYAAGAVDFLTAPINPEELRAKVSALANLYLQAQAEAAKARDLQVTAQQLRLLTDAAPIGIFQTDTENRYTYTNLRWSEITGVTREAALGTEWDGALGAAHLAGADAATEGGQPVGKEISARLTITPASGPPRVAVLTARPLLEDGRPAGWVGTLADITAEAEAEEALVRARDTADEALLLKSDFLANMSHEIRTPLSGVIGWTELLRETELDADQRGFVETLSRSGVALMNVVDAILDFSKIEAGRLHVDQLEFDPRSVVAEVVDLLAHAARTKGLQLDVDYETSIPAAVRGDANRLRQVLTNLVGNAIKFTKSGGVVVHVSADLADGPHPVLRFEVSDTGVGIAADKIAMIFDPFTQADTSITREHGGTGLGLAISSQLTGLMGGQVGVTSEVGAGSTFWFTIGVVPAVTNA
ncbi:ATP-binding protein [Nocardioides sp.]|uniref:hybrid sensor histidine kinase/response regulator n=1 Tax=Nocardioides sp. TaxID=35761 RepID=UPI001A1ED939|nr:ATP-binding protein [Nocardioides sp.]MBJ7357437.1 response regulator [Nocardioides sp.]